MKITVLSGSPKGKYSITLQSALYLQLHNPDDEFTIFHVGQKICKYEDDVVMGECIAAMADSDVVLFAYPVYTFLATSQLARFIEMMKAHPDAPRLKGRFATQITTSKHFYDTTAHRYIEDNAADLGMKIIPGLTADMDDLLLPQGRKQLKDFYKRVRFATHHDIYDRRIRQQPCRIKFDYMSSIAPVPKKTGFDTVIVSDCADDNVMLRRMIDAFVAAYPYPVREVNIAKFQFAGGCLGCFQCASDGHCVYRDGYEDLLRGEVLNADMLIYAATIRDHSLGARFKCFHDRQFCNGHRIMTVGKSTGYILDGGLSAERNLCDVIQARSEVGNMTLADVATNEGGSSAATDESIVELAKTAAFSLENGIEAPQGFFGVGGTKIFRDLIFMMRGLMHADHKHYKKHGVYDFPHKKRGLILKMQLVGLMMRSPDMRKRMGNRMNKAMMSPYKKAMGRE